MKTKRVVYTVSTGARPIGEHTMHEPMPDKSFEQFDPFLLLHHHGPHEFGAYNQGLPFGPHPHRGFETLTLVYEGSIEHADSQGFRSVIDAGGIQWMTAGRGLVHSENLPAEMRENGGRLEIIQLWMNLRQKDKMVPPQYYGLQEAEIPVRKKENFSFQIISGGEREAVASISNLSIWNVKASAGGVEIQVNVPVQETTLIYVLSGILEIGGKKVGATTLAELSKDEGVLALKAIEDTRFLFISGKAFKEPIAAQGPFVMNSTTEILQAMRDYQMGKMGVM